MHMPLVLTNRRRRGGSASAPAFSPSTLFSSGSQGIWLDPSDLSTMFSDRAGTTAVTTPGTVVGLRLDKSKGLVLGAETVANPGNPFVSTTGYSAGGSATISVDTGRLKVAQTTGFTDGVLCALPNNTFASSAVISFDVDLGSASLVQVQAGNGAFGNGGVITVNITASGTYSIRTTTRSSGVNGLTFKAGSAANFFLSRVSVRELAGNHAVAPTDAARPIYGVEPKGGRRNLLTWSEGFDNAVWAKPGVTVTQSSGAEWAFTPTVTNNAKNVTQSVVVGATAAISIEAKPSGYTKCVLQIATGITAIFDLSAITATVTGGTGTASIVASGDGYYRCTAVPAAVTAGTRNFDMFVADAGSATAFAGNGTSAILVRRPQFETGSTATAYQRVTTAYDVTESGVATCHYVQYDGSDDSMSTAAIDFTGTDKMSVFAGVRKLSDVEMTIVELSNTWWNNTGTFAVGTLPTPYFSYSPALRGTASTYYTAGVDSTPNSRVLSALFDIAGTTSSQEVVFRADGTLKTLTSVSGTNAGTGNFGNYPLFLGRRGGATLPLNGRDYGIVIVGKTASAGEISDTETWLAAKTAQVAL